MGFSVLRVVVWVFGGDRLFVLLGCLVIVGVCSILSLWMWSFVICSFVIFFRRFLVCRMCIFLLVIFECYWVFRSFLF